MTVDEQAPFTELVHLMAVHKVSALPVVDGEGRVVGLVSGTVPGVVDVVNQLTFALDDDRLEMPHSRSFLP